MSQQTTRLYVIEEARDVETVACRGCLHAAELAGGPMQLPSLPEVFCDRCGSLAASGVAS